jgi:hypothetical protein
MIAKLQRLMRSELTALDRLLNYVIALLLAGLAHKISKASSQPQKTRVRSNRQAEGSKRPGAPVPE